MRNIEDRLTEALAARAEQVDASGFALATGSGERQPSILRRYRGWALVPAAAATVVGIIAGASALTSPASHTARPATSPKPIQTAQHPTSPPARASLICRGALGDQVATAAKTTLNDVRHTTIVGLMGIQGTRGKGAFPGLPGSQVAAWCWTPESGAGDGSPGGGWLLYVAIPDGRSKHLFGMDSSDPAPVGPPNLP